MRARTYRTDNVERVRATGNQSGGRRNSNRRAPYARDTVRVAAATWTTPQRHATVGTMAAARPATRDIPFGPPRHLTRY